MAPFGIVLSREPPGPNKVTSKTSHLYLVVYCDLRFGETTWVPRLGDLFGKPHGTLQDPNTQGKQEDDKQEYLIYRRGGHTGKGAERNYIVGWYRYKKADETAEYPLQDTRKFI